jgi:two-component sensor histidine kinase
MKVSVATKSPQFQKLASDLWAGFCANEIIKEGLGNAFRHGLAKQVFIKFESEKPGFVTIEIINDGKSPNKKARTGLGSQLLSEIANPWSITKNPSGGGVLRAQLPVSKSKNKVS